MSGFKLTEVQANAILDMRLARLAALERKKIDDEYKQVLKLIKDLEAILADPNKVLDLIRADMAELKEKYGDERRTRIQDVSGVLSEEDLIPEVDVLVTITNKGYVKRIANDVYREQHRGGRGITGVTMRDEDKIQHILAANTMDSLLVFTSRGRVYQVKVHELPDAGRTAKGVPIVNVINLQPDETVTTLMNIKTYDDAKYLFFTTRQGVVKRTSLDQFRQVRSTGMIAIGMREDDELAWVRQTSGDDEVILVSEMGQAIKFHETDARAMGRSAAGVIGMRLDSKDRVIAFEVVDPTKDLLVVSARGFGKRTDLNLFRGQGRGGKGIQAMKLTPKTGHIVAAGIVDDESSVMLMNSKGVIIRIAAKQISRLGRSTQGVTLMRFSDGEQVVTMTIAQNKDDGDGLHGVDPAMIMPNGATEA
jgi:DNA gyrase subunit A